MSIKVIVLLGLCLQLLNVHAEISFSSYQTKFNKLYSSESERSRREHVFNDNVAKIQKHNENYKKGLVSYEMGVNQFTDLTDEEFDARFPSMALDSHLLTTKMQDSTQMNLGDLPESIDWRDKNAVTEVKDQGLCNSCWSFSATGTLEGQLALKYDKLTSLSEQQILDCDPDENGCTSGIVQHALKYVAENGLTTEEDYPYIFEKSDTCSTFKPFIKATSYVQVPFYNETELKIAVGLKGPVSVAINITPIKNYHGGIFDDTCSDDVNHAVLAVGYGKDDTTGQEYWILKNSWNTTFGEEGYLKLALGTGLCGVARQACYPTGVAYFDDASSL